MTKRNLWLAGLLLAALLPAACSDRSEPAAPNAQALAPRADAARFPPTDLGPTITLNGADLKIFPYTADSLPAHPVDPINLVFVGPYADPRNIRAALLHLTSDRTGIGLPPGMMPGISDCHWEDGIGGGNQIAYVDGKGWMGSVIQLVCGPYNVMRFHIRLFPFGNVTLAGAHFEMNIPGTADHESLSWELARGVVVTDLLTSGRATSLGDVTTGSHPGTYRSVRSEIYNDPNAGALRYLLAQLGNTGPAILNSGQATVLQLNEPPAAPVGSKTVTLPLDYGIIMPQPFCKDGEYLQVVGPVQLSQTTTFTAAGDYSATFEATALVDVKALVGGGQFQARIHQVEASTFSDHVAQVTTRLSQRMTPPAPGRGFQVKWLRVGPGDAANYQNQVHCYGN